jgi:hypothetical protein
MFMNAANTVDLLNSSDSEISLCQEIREEGAVFNVYIAMSDLLNTRANSRDGHSPETLLQVYNGLIDNRGAIFNYLNSLGGENVEDQESSQFKAAMLYTVIPDSKPSYRDSRKNKIVESLIKIWQTVRSVGIALPPQSVITGRRCTSNSPESQAIAAFGSFASVMLQAEYSCANAQTEKETKMKMMKTVKVSGENRFISLV